MSCIEDLLFIVLHSHNLLSEKIGKIVINSIFYFVQNAVCRGILR